VSAATVTVGLISVEIFEGKVNAILTIGCARPIVIDVSAAAAQRMFDELTRIRTALLAANAVLHDDTAPPGPVTRSEVHLANLLLDLGISGSTP
jgi:hypothetical protein